MHTAARWVTVLSGLCLAACAHPTTANTTPQPQTFLGTELAQAPDWPQLDFWQGAVSETEWQAALTERYAPHDVAKGLIELNPTSLNVLEHKSEPGNFYALRNRAPDIPRPAPPPGTRYWRTRAELGPATPEHPLAGLRVALDPGHLGGRFAGMEARSFSVDGRPSVREGDLALRVAQILQPRLEALGANVTFVRDRPGPVTTDTPESLGPMAEAQWLAGAAAKYGTIPPPGDPRREHDVQKLAEQLFYRDSEIRARALRVNKLLRPDLVLCLHLDAVDWPDPKKLSLVQGQHFHILVNGAYSTAELAGDQARLDLVLRIASGAGDEELAVARAMAEAAAPIFGLPAFGYNGPNAVALGGDGYVWGRNLIADRLYQCPVVFFEPYVMNSVEGYERIQAGEYPGTRVFNGRERKNIFEEYADAVVAGLVKYYGARPAAAPAGAAARR